ncbi:MAG: hypothetical protein DRO13_01765, partial [Thermoprotei archaeon]
MQNYKTVEIKDKPVIIWARRLTRYKRPYFIARFIMEHPDLEACLCLEANHILKIPSDWSTR